MPAPDRISGRDGYAFNLQPNYGLNRNKIMYIKNNRMYNKRLFLFWIGTPLLFLLLSLPSRAQHSRLGGKTNVAYRDNYQRMSAGYGHILEIRNGKLYASGNNTSGQLGNGTVTFDRQNAVQVGTETDWVQTAAGEAHSLGIRADGSLWAWGKNDKGQLGNGNTGDQHVPVQIGTDRWINISAGGKFSVAVRADGTLWAWGENDNGQLGNGDTDYGAQPTPAQIGNGQTWLSVSAGEKHALALKADGTLWAWGFGLLGQIGNGTTDTDNPDPVQVGSDENWKSISAGGYFSAAIKADGSLYTWGDNYYNQVPGSPVTGGMPTPNPVRTGTENTWVNVEAGRYHILAGKADGTVWAWGKNEAGELGTGGNQPTAPVQITGTNGIVQLAAGDGFSLALNSKGSLLAWGQNTFGQFYDGGTQTRNVPQSVSTVLEVVSVTAAHGFHTMTLYSNGTLNGWGANGDYQLGDGTDVTRYAPVGIHAAGNNNIALVMGFSHNLVLKDNGTLWGWGDNSLGGPIGTGASGYEKVPVQIGTDNNWAALTAGTFTSAGIRADGSLWAWGSNGDGEVGDGSETDVPAPVRIGGDNDWVSVSIGSSHTLAIKANGTLWGWGNNYSGEAGGGSNQENVLEPQQIGTDRDWAAIHAAGSSSFAIKANGTLWSFGSASMGQLGNGATDPSSVTEPVEIGSGYLHAKLGNWSGVGLKADGTLMGWGNLNSVFGELGMGNKNNYLNPTPIPGQSGVVQITSGQAHRGLIKADRNDVCMTGRNWDGELGINVVVGDSSSYVCGIAPAVSAPAPGTGIDVHTLNNQAPTIDVNAGTLQLEATITPASSIQTVTWSIVPVTGAATISNTGLVTAQGNGTLWAKAVSTVYAPLADSLLLTISNQIIPATGIDVHTLNNVPATITVAGGTLQAVAEITPAEADQSVTWQIVPVTGTAGISNTGLVTAQTNGTVWVRAISVQNPALRDSFLLTVSNQLIPVVSLTISVLNQAPPLITQPGGTLQLLSAIVPSNANQAVTWSIVPITGTATISANGLVTAQSNGSVWAKTVSVENTAVKDSLMLHINNQNLGLEEAAANAPHIYPNPAEQWVSVEAGMPGQFFELDVLDMTGKRMLQTLSAESVRTVDISA